MDSRKRPAQDVDEVEGGGSRKRFQGKSRFPEEPLLKLLVPNTIAGQIIGKGGSYLAELKSNYGGHIRLSGNKEYFPGTEERVVIITGKVSEIIDLNYVIMDKVLNPGRDSFDDAQKRGEKTMFVVTNEGAGSLIGKRGSVMKQLTEESGAKIMIADSLGEVVHGDRVLTIRGSVEQRHEASKLIIEKIAEEPTNMANTRLNYGKGMDAPDTGRGGGDGFRDGYRDGGHSSFGGNMFDRGMRDSRDRGRDTGGSGGLFDGRMRDSRDQSRDGDNYDRMFSQRESRERIFSSPPRRNDLGYQEITENSIVGLIETAAAAMDKRQILAALTGAQLGGGSSSQAATNASKPAPPAPRRKAFLKHSLELKVEVPSHKVGHLMGKGGKNVKDMVRRSGGARFAFEDASRDGEADNQERRDSKVRTVTVSGTFEQVEAAFDLIHEKVEEFDQYRREVFQPRDY